MSPSRRTPDGTKSYTAPAVKKRGRISLNPVRLESHFLGTDQGNTIGLHAIGQNNTCRWVALDIDEHGDGEGKDKNLAAAIWWYDFLLGMDYHPLLTDSNGKGGFHLHVVFSSPIPSVDAYHFIRGIAGQFKAAGLGKPPEQFPKQSSIGSEQFGNWLRIPGRHHTEQHWSKVWDGGEWLEGDEAVEAILSLELCPPPTVDVPVDKQAEESLESIYNPDEQKDILLQCVAGLPADLHYDEWIRVGMSLHNLLSADGLKLWDGYSRRGSNYKEGECEKKWGSFTRQAGKKCGLATLIRLAEANGAKLTMPDMRPLTAWQRNAPAPSAEIQALPIVSTAVCLSEDPRPILYDADGPRARIANVEDYERTDDRGNSRPGYRYIRLPFISNAIKATTGGWPARAGGIMFVAEHQDGPIPDRGQLTWIGDPSQLFAWMQHCADVRWTEKEAEGTEKTKTTLNPPTKKELYFYLRDHCRNYRSVECLPHYPPVKDVYYLPTQLPTVDTTSTTSPLIELVSRLNCDTEEDRILMLAALVTPGWGGPAGTRPAFVFSSEYGRGSGKTVTALVFARLWGGCMSFTANEDWQKIRGRLLGDEALTMRVCLLDNIKGKKNDQDLESIITSSVIDGWKPYHGQASRPNLLTWYLTCNSPSVSNDLAERSVVIRMGPQKHEKDFVSWAEDHIDRYRAEILSEIFALLRGPAACEITNRDRWVAWQNGVLSLFSNGNDLAKLIVDRRVEVDSDREDAEAAAEILKKLMEKHGFNPETANVFITATQAFKAMREAAGIGEDMGVKACSSYLKDKCGIGALGRLKWKKAELARGFIWTANRGKLKYQPLSEEETDLSNLYRGGGH